MHHLSLKELIAGLAKKQFSSVELTQHYAARIKQFDPKLNTLITFCEEQALTEAKAADEQRQQGAHHPLAGIPLAHKDIFCTTGVKTSCGSKMLDNFIAPYDATVVSRARAAGLVMLGKTNMDEFAMGSSNENSYYGPVKNPWDITRVPGGSSGGSAAMLAARLTPLATGTDTGGSIRQPAAFCGISGLKPSYGRVSRHGMVAFASSLDQGGIFGHSAEDIAYLLEIISGHDPRDSTSVARPVPNYSTLLDGSLKGLKIGLPKEYFSAALDKSIAEVLKAALRVFEDAGAICQEISLPHTEQAIPAYYIIAPAECSANLARYDGVRYGYRCEAPRDLKDLYCRSRSEGFGEEVKRRILIGTYVLQSGYYDAYYHKAQQVRRLITEDFNNAFKQVDIILGPTAPTTAFPLNAKNADPVTMYLSDIYTIAVNLAGLPAMSIPAGFQDNLPVGMQLISPYFSEEKLLQVAHQYQLATTWHQQTPAGY